MTPDHEQPSQHRPLGEAATTAELLDRLRGFAGTPEEFLGELLKVQCRLGGASGGAILRGRPGGRAEVLAVFPPANGAEPPAWLAEAADRAGAVLSEGVTAVRALHDAEDLYGQPARQQLVIIPLTGAAGASVRGLAAFVVSAADETAAAAARARLEQTPSLLGLYEICLTAQRRAADLQRLRNAMEVLAAVNEHARFAGAAMAFCNEVASRWQAHRVGLGFLAGRYVQLKAMSHTEKFTRKMKVVQDVEAAMEECIDQDVEIAHPPEPDSACVSRAAGELSQRHGPAAVLSLPLREAGEPFAVLTVETPAQCPPDLAQTESLRLACDLCAVRLRELHAHDRWFGAIAAGGVRKVLGAAVGPRHTWLKLAAVAAFAVVAVLVFARGDYRAEASFVLETTRQRVVAAPFDGFLQSASARVGDAVVAARTPLAELDATELRLQLAAAKAERLTYQKQAAAAMRDEKTAEAQIANAQADKVAAQVRLLEHRIGKARIVAPISGVVIAGELERHVGAPVKTGDTLFQIAPLGALRAELAVPEDQIAEVRPGQTGELATASYPDVRVPFVVEHINPVAEVVGQQNVFKVRVRLLKTESWMHPGMGGVAKVTIGRRRLVWLWTRKLVNWLRMKLWL